MNSVSVAMATYNGQRHLRRQLDSLAEQTYLPAELIVTDDDSKDDTLGVVEAFAKTAPFRVSIHRNEQRLGYRANFMKAADLCNSELIAFCDQDDYWYPHKIASSIEPFSDPDVLLSYHNANIVRDGVQVGSLSDRGLDQPVVGPLSLGPWWPFGLGFTDVFRRSLLQFSYLWPKTLDHIFFGVPSGHDQWVFFLASVFGKIAYLPEPLVDYTQHETNTYGWGRESFSHWIRARLRDNGESYRHLSKAAAARALVLDLAKEGIEGIWAERAAKGAAYYRTVSSVNSWRTAVYAAPKFAERLSAIRKITRVNGYSGSCGLGSRSFYADMCVGVLSLGSLVRSTEE